MEFIEVKKGVCMNEKSEEKNMDIIRKGPWSAEEDTILINSVAKHGDRAWNSLARSSGLKRSGKSCRLRWLNYLRPNVRHGNITLPEQITILDLHSRWGNRWSKIAQYLPGRTDNEIKNFWRTKVTKQAKQLKCDVNSVEFRDALHNVWMPLLRQRVQPPSEIVPNPSPGPGPGPGPGPSSFRLNSSGSRTLWPNNTNSSSGGGGSTSTDSSSVQLRVVSDSDHSVCYDQIGQNEPGPCPSPSFNGLMFEYTSGEMVLESLWDYDNTWVLPPMCDYDHEMLNNSFLA